MNQCNSSTNRAHVVFPLVLSLANVVAIYTILAREMNEGKAIIFARYGQKRKTSEDVSLLSSP